MRRLILPFALLIALFCAAPAFAGEPPNQNDPCAKGGKDTCSTTGVGAYRNYKYGVRWFGDYRNAVPGVSGATFCIDLRYWYPGKNYGYDEHSPNGLKNRDGDSVSTQALHRMAYALWNYGRSSDKAQQGAVMLYVHGLMGDAAPGEVSPGAVGSSAISSKYDTIARNAAKYAGPYKLDAKIPGGLKIGQKSTATLRVLAASGAALPGVKISLDASGASGVPSSVTTNSSGTASVSFTASSKDLSISAESSTLASTLPRLFVPTNGQAPRNGQRLVAPDSQTVKADVAGDATPTQIKVTTKATPDVIVVGSQTRDIVKITGAPSGYKTPVEVRLYGPAPSSQQISCTGTPAFTGSYTAGGGGSGTPPFVPFQPGWYGYQLVIPDQPGVGGVTTPCPTPEESVRVEVAPQVHTEISTTNTSPGATLHDKVVVSGLAGQTATVNAALYGPYPSPDKITCQGAPFWQGSLTANGDGEYTTDDVTLTVSGYYTYKESIPAQGFVRAADTTCADVAETVIVKGKPQIHTQVSAQQTAPGSQITDQVVVTGLGGLSANVNAVLYGPFPTAADIQCGGTPVWSGTFAATGDGTYTTAAVTLPAAGYYIYQESILPTDTVEGVLTPCGDAAETTLAKGKPTVETEVSDSVVKPGSQLSDNVKVSGLGTTAATIRVELYGPFSTRAGIGCKGTPASVTNLDVPGDGEYKSEAVPIKDAGFYVFHESIKPSATTEGVNTPCDDVAETSLGAPLIITGRGEKTGTPSAYKAQAGRITPKSIQVGGRTATIVSEDIDIKQGVLNVPTDIAKVGWWRDGSTLGDDKGTILLAGHVDSAARGAGAFYSLKSARKGMRVKVNGSDGKSRTYRVTGVRKLLKADLPTSVYDTTGPKRLVMVTCGGPFDTKTGHYRDNIIVTAVLA